MVNKIRNFLTTHIFSAVSGYTFKDWIHCLAKHHFKVSLRYIPRLLFVTINSIANSLAKKNDEKIFSTLRNNIDVKEPVFILGHWRSGTTHLHNLLSQDPHFSTPDFAQVTMPHTFLSMGKKTRDSKIIKLMTPKTRLIDNMNADMSAPMEDEVALAILTGMSPVEGFMFPSDMEEYDKYLTFRDVPEEDVYVWKRKFQWFLKKMTLESKKQLIIKSPPHTCRIKLILEAFPDAKFIHIHRNPYEVFRSYKKASQTMQKMIQLQSADNSLLDQRIINQYKKMYEVFLEEKKHIPPGHFVEVSYQNLENRPIDSLEYIYQTIHLGDFEKVKEKMTSYLISLSSYKKSELSPLPPDLVENINTQWDPFFKEWNYRKLAYKNVEETSLSF